MKDRIIFQDKKLDTDFKQKGYVIINLLDQQTVLQLRQEVSQLDAGVDAPFYTSLWSSNAEYRKKVDELIHRAILPRVASYFHQYEPLFGDLLVKRPSLTKDFPVHQDWTFVDEDVFTSVYVWCPLQDVGYLNGNLQVVEGSHHFLDRIRGANIKVSYESIKPEIKKRFLKSIPLKAGQAILFNQALLHASPPNRSLKTRIAMGLLMLPKEADIYHYFYDKEKAEVKRIKANKDFFMHYSENFDFQNALKNNSFDLTNLGSTESIINRKRQKMNWQTFTTMLTQCCNKKGQDDFKTDK